ncbi:hypothetical protein DIPPA_11020 [Diplonema papillatum]|nr:hypothetical protein DIPPA_11020 [Diplonema papillatum]
MAAHVDPAAGLETARIVSDAVQFKALQAERKLWQEGQDVFAGAEGTVEVRYPNGDVALSFANDEWLRVHPDALDDGAPVQKKGTSAVVSNSAVAINLRATGGSGAPSGVEWMPCGVDPDYVSIAGVVPGIASAEDLKEYTGFVVTHVDGRDMRLHTPEEVERAVQVGACVRGYSSLTLRRAEDVEMMRNMMDEAANPPKPAPAPHGLAVMKYEDAPRLIEQSLPDARSAVRAAEQNLRALQEAVLAQQLELFKFKENVRDQLETSTAAPTPSEPAETPAAGDAQPDRPPVDIAALKAIQPVVPIEGKDDLLTVFRGLNHGKRREGVERALSVLGDPKFEDLEYWDLRNASDDAVKPGLEQVALDIFYFGEPAEAGDENAFKANMIEKLAEFGVHGVVAPTSLKEAGCMYPLLGIPIILPWESAVTLGNLVFEDFGIVQDELPAHGEDQPQKGGGCASQ